MYLPLHLHLRVHTSLFPFPFSSHLSFTSLSSFIFSFSLLSSHLYLFSCLSLFVFISVSFHLCLFSSLFHFISVSFHLHLSLHTQKRKLTSQMIPPTRNGSCTSQDRAINLSILAVSKPGEFFTLCQTTPQTPLLVVPFQNPQTSIFQKVMKES